MRYQVVISTGGRKPRRERAMVETLLEDRTDGIILVSPRMETAAIMEAAEQLPVVVVGRRVRGLDCVLTDEPTGARLAVEHLVGLGHTRIVHVDGGAGAGAAPRRAGYVRAMGEAGLEPQVIPGDFTEDAGVTAPRASCSGAATCRPPCSPPTTSWPRGCWTRSRTTASRVPEDVSIVGYDNTFLAGLHRMSLTTIDQPRVQMGRLALELLLERVDGRREPRLHLTEPTLVVRATSGPAP